MFVENHSVKIVHLNGGKRIGTISFIEPVIDEYTENVRNASLGLITDTLHQSVSNFNNNRGGGCSATRYKSTFQTDLEKSKFIIHSFGFHQNPLLNNDAELKKAVIKLFLYNSEF